MHRFLDTNCLTRPGGIYVVEVPYEEEYLNV